jgi:hypothetical protein
VLYPREGRRGERVRDASTGSARRLTLVVVMIGVLTCPSPKGDGIELNPFLCESVVEFPKQCSTANEYWFLP